METHGGGLPPAPVRTTSRLVLLDQFDLTQVKIEEH